MFVQIYFQFWGKQNIAKLLCTFQHEVVMDVLKQVSYGTDLPSFLIFLEKQPTQHKFAILYLNHVMT